jgi:hypothetical protein
VVIIYGSGGVAGNLHDWSQQLNEAGIATFLLDSGQPFTWGGDSCVERA